MRTPRVCIYYPGKGLKNGSCQQYKCERVCIVGYWANFTMGPNEQNQHFAELRQMVSLYIHNLVHLSCLPNLDVKHKHFVKKEFHLLVVFIRLFAQAEQRSVVPPIMMIERYFTCSNKKTNMDKNSIQRNSWTFGSPACQKI